MIYNMTKEQVKFYIVHNLRNLGYDAHRKDIRLNNIHLWSNEHEEGVSCIYKGNLIKIYNLANAY